MIVDANFETLYTVTIENGYTTMTDPDGNDLIVGPWGDIMREAIFEIANFVPFPCDDYRVKIDHRCGNRCCPYMHGACVFRPEHVGLFNWTTRIEDDRAAYTGTLKNAGEAPFWIVPLKGSGACVVTVVSIDDVRRGVYDT